MQRQVELPVLMWNLMPLFSPRPAGAAPGTTAAVGGCDEASDIVMVVYVYRLVW